MTTSIDTSVTSLSIRLAEPEIPPTLGDFQVMFDDLESLLFLGSLVSTIGPEVPESWWQTDPLSGLSLNRFSPGQLISPNIVVSSQHLAESFRIVQMSYRSPIEILMQTGGVYGHIAAIGSAAYLSIRGVLSLWGLACDTKRKHDETKLVASDVKVAIQINDRLQEALPLFTGSNMDRVELDDSERRALGKPISQRIEGASKILASAEEIAVVET